MRVTARLVSVADETILWADEFAASEPGIQLVALQIAAEVRKVVTGSSEQMVGGPLTESAEVFRLYLLGRESQTSLDPASIYESLELLEKAASLDPEFALAQAALAESHYMLWWLNLLPPTTAVAGLESAARRALELDPKLAAAYAWLGMIELTHRYRFEEARTLFDHANHLAPNTPCVHRFYCQYFVVTRQFDEALRLARHAQVLDPTSPEIKTVVAEIFMFNRDYRQAIDLFQSLVLPGGKPTRATFLLAWCHIFFEDYEAALKMFAPDSAATHPWVHALKCHAHARMGNTAQADHHFAEIQRGSAPTERDSFVFASAYVGRGKLDEAIACLEEGYRRGEPAIAYIAVTPLWDPLRENPRFQTLVRRVVGSRS